MEVHIQILSLHRCVLRLQTHNRRLQHNLSTLEIIRAFTFSMARDIAIIQCRRVWSNNTANENLEWKRSLGVQADAPRSERVEICTTSESVQVRISDSGKKKVCQCLSLRTAWIWRHHSLLISLGSGCGSQTLLRLLHSICTGLILSGAFVKWY